MSLFPLFSSKITLHLIEYALESYWFPSSLLLIFHWLPSNITNSLYCSSIYCIQLNMNWIPIVSLLPCWYSFEWLAMSLFPLFSSKIIQLNMHWNPIDSLLLCWYSIEWLTMPLMFPLFSIKMTLHSIEFALKSYCIIFQVIFHWMIINVIDS